MKVVPNDFVHTLNARANIMINAAVCGSKEEFEQAATVFFRSANDSRQIGNAINAYYTNIKGIQPKDVLALKLKGFLGVTDSINNVVICSLDESVKNNSNLNYSVKKFVALTKEYYHKSLGDRIAALEYGTVNSFTTHKTTSMERAKTLMSKFVREFLAGEE